MSRRPIEQLREEIEEIDQDLMRLGEHERDAERGIVALVLLAHRGDEEAEKQINEHEKSRAATVNSRRRLQAARVSIEAELQMAVAVIEREAVKEKAREAKEIVATCRKRGSELDVGLRKLVEDYLAIQGDVAALTRLGATRINPELVRVNCLRALTAALMQTDLGLPLVPPLARHSFSELVGGWSNTAERWIETALTPPEESVAQTEPTYA
jgi:hypothetical protein